MIDLNCLYLEEAGYLTQELRFAKDIHPSHEDHYMLGNRRKYV